MFRGICSRLLPLVYCRLVAFEPATYSILLGPFSISFDSNATLFPLSFNFPLLLSSYCLLCSPFCFNWIFLYAISTLRILESLKPILFSFSLDIFFSLLSFARCCCCWFHCVRLAARILFDSHALWKFGVAECVYESSNFDSLAVHLKNNWVLFYFQYIFFVFFVVFLLQCMCEYWVWNECHGNSWAKMAKNVEKQFLQPTLWVRVMFNGKLPFTPY